METEPHPVLLHALADVRRQQIVHAKFSEATRDLYPDAFAYAVANSVCPVLHEDAGLEDPGDGLSTQHPFRSTYRVPYGQVKELAELLDAKWMAKETITFYDVEDHYGRTVPGTATWKGTDLRMDLIHCCRYFALNGLFGDDFWTAFLSNAPSEANDLARPFSLDDLRQY